MRQVQLRMRAGCSEVCACAGCSELYACAGWSEVCARMVLRSVCMRRVFRSVHSHGAHKYVRTGWSEVCACAWCSEVCACAGCSEVCAAQLRSVCAGRPRVFCRQATGGYQQQIFTFIFSSDIYGCWLNYVTEIYNIICINGSGELLISIFLYTRVSGLSALDAEVSQVSRIAHLFRFTPGNSYSKRSNQSRSFQAGLLANHPVCQSLLHLIMQDWLHAHT